MRHLLLQSILAMARAKRRARRAATLLPYRSRNSLQRLESRILLFICVDSVEFGSPLNAYRVPSTMMTVGTTAVSYER